MFGSFLKWFGFQPLAVAIMNHEEDEERHYDHKFNLILNKLECIMAAIDDLKTAVGALTASFTGLDTAIQAEIKALTDALAAGSSADVTAAAQAISDLSSKMAADAAALTASLPVAVVVPPPPVVTP